MTTHSPIKLTMANQAQVDIAKEAARQLLVELQTESIWLSPEQYALRWGISRRKVCEWIELGHLDQALCPGTETKGRHKKICRFYNPWIMRTDYTKP